ncbi:hypothetical protein ACIP1T_24030 [Pseudomonas japonica]|uniref:hypothetical protein n=1 Tax=Pseudomonas japonica TaxID=256466 RepID=UPI0037F1AFDB
MSEQTLQNLLAAMKDRPITLGWGAVLCFGRSRLNALLEGQFVDRLASFQQMSPVNGVVCLNQECTESATLTNVRLGQPRLSFERASLRSSTVTLVLPLVSGNFSVMTQHVGMTPMLLSSVDLDESLGFSLSVDLSLSQASGEVDQSGRISLDLGEGRSPRCNLLPYPAAQELLGNHIQQHVGMQPYNRRVFELGLFEFTSYHPLSPVSFQLLTQKAPGSNDGDGAVVVFVRLHGNHGNGTLPVDDGDFPYLIPSDRQGQEPRWSASLVLAEDMIEWLDEERLDVLKNLLFPGRSVFVESADGRHRPHDLLVLGNIMMSPGTAMLEPLSGSIRAGQTRQFVARRADGSVIPNVAWRTRSLGSPLSVGTISPSGLYTAPDAATMAHDATPALVLGEYSEGGQTREIAATLLGRFEAMSIFPRVVLCRRGDDPLEIRAAGHSAGTPQWGLVAPAVGSLQVTAPGVALYTPPADIDTPVVLQRIECRLPGAVIETAVIILKGIATAAVEPFFVPAIDFDAPLRFYNESPPGWARWSVLGDGTVDSDGMFTPPALPSGSPVSLVCCEVLYNGTGPVMASGFAIVRLVAKEIPPPRWKELDYFRIKPLGGRVQAYANGNQQIPLLIEIRTSTVPVDGQQVHIRLSETELASLRLFDQSGNDVPFINADQEGMAHDATTPWAVHQRRNRFNLYSPNGVEDAAGHGVAAPRNDGISFRELYVHVREQGSRTFYARFTGDDRRVYNSNDKTVEHSEIELTGMMPPAVDPVVGPGHHFDMIRERVYSGSGHGGPDGGDDFSYYLQSVDYWRINYNRAGIYPMPFATLRIERNVSTIRWESEQMDETFFSFTGYAFHPYRSNFSGIDQRPTGLTFDAYFLALNRLAAATPPRVPFEPGKQPSPGELIVSLQRVDDMTYWYDGMAAGQPNRMFRSQLDAPVVFVLLDVEGNRHRLQVSFQPPSTNDNRNYLNLSIQ